MKISLLPPLTFDSEDFTEPCFVSSQLDQPTIYWTSDWDLACDSIAKEYPGTNFISIEHKNRLLGYKAIGICNDAPFEVTITDGKTV